MHVHGSGGRVEQPKVLPRWHKVGWPSGLRRWIKDCCANAQMVILQFERARVQIPSQPFFVTILIFPHTRDLQARKSMEILESMVRKWNTYRRRLNFWAPK
eukprot:308212-Chlamydomonas_euryale.AAC.1